MKMSTTSSRGAMMATIVLYSNDAERIPATLTLLDCGCRSMVASSIGSIKDLRCRSETEKFMFMVKRQAG